MLLFARVHVLGVAWLRIVSAAVIFAAWRRPWRALRPRALPRLRPLLIAWASVLAAMNCCFYEAIHRLPLATVAAIEFLPLVALAALAARSTRNAVALVSCCAGVYLLTGVHLVIGGPAGLAFAFANAALFAAYVVLAHRAAGVLGRSSVDGLAAAMALAAVIVTPVGAPAVVRVLGNPLVLLAGVGVGVSSSVVPYVSDQVAMRRMSRGTYSLLASLLPAIATATGLVVLAQLPSPRDAGGILLVMAGVALHRDRYAAA